MRVDTLCSAHQNISAGIHIDCLKARLTLKSLESHDLRSNTGLASGQEAPSITVPTQALRS